VQGFCASMHKNFAQNRQQSMADGRQNQYFGEFCAVIYRTKLIPFANGIIQQKLY
jgi:hypothetical protein